MGEMALKVLCVLIICCWLLPSRAQEPVDCQYMFYETPCSATCGSGEISVQFDIIAHPQNGGQECPEPFTMPCEAEDDCPEEEDQPEPIDCVYEVQLGPCSVTCGTGEQVMGVTIIRPAQHGGQPCRQAVTLQCEAGDCPDGSDGSENVDCRYELVRGACSVTCGEGVRQITVNVISEPKNDGKACPLGGTVECDLGECPVDCDYVFEDVGRCSATCGNGVQYRLIDITTPAQGDGQPCPPDDSTQTVHCNIGPCPGADEDQPDPVNCDYDVVLGPCSVSCGTGEQTMGINIFRPAQYGGTPCPESKTIICEAGDCPGEDQPDPIDCDFEVVFGPCSVSCGTGEKNVRVNVFRPDQYGGEPCPESTIMRCEAGDCPEEPPAESEAVDCVYELVRGACSATCGAGESVITANIISQAENGGEPCPGDDTVACSLQECPVDCLYEYENSGGCSESCGDGVQHQRVKIKTPAQGDGRPCPAEDATKTVHCNLGECPVDCLYEYENIGGCSASCGDGEQKQRVKIKTPAQGDGRPCPAEDTTKSVACNLGECPVDCLYEYENIGGCSASCGDGVQNQRVKIKTPAQGDGQPCPAEDATKTVACNLRECPAEPVDCRYDIVTGPCGVTCGTGMKTVSFKEITPAENGGTPCPPPSTISCYEGECPPVETDAVDCLYDWVDDPSGCSVSCGDGLKKQSITVTTHSEGAGRACPVETTREVACNLGTCEQCTNPSTPCTDCWDLNYADYTSGKTGGRILWANNRRGENGPGAVTSLLGSGGVIEVRSFQVWKFVLPDRSDCLGKISFDVNCYSKVVLRVFTGPAQYTDTVYKRSAATDDTADEFNSITWSSSEAAGVNCLPGVRAFVLRLSPNRKDPACGNRMRYKNMQASAYAINPGVCDNCWTLNSVNYAAGSTGELKWLAVPQGEQEHDVANALVGSGSAIESSESSALWFDLPQVPGCLGRVSLEARCYSNIVLKVSRNGNVLDAEGGFFEGPTVSEESANEFDILTWSSADVGGVCWSDVNAFIISVSVNLADPACSGRVSYRSLQAWACQH